MKELPIIFSTPMVQANLEGRKTMTRRLKGLDKINKPGKSFYFQSLVHHATGRFTFVEEGNYNPTESDVIIVKPPYNRGDLLWVRETYCPTGSDEYLNISTNKPFFYKADVKDKGIVSDMMPEYGWKWKPSIYMPKAAARIWLQVKEVRIERLHEIILQDIESEGIQNKSHEYASPNHAFENIWSKINGQESWNSNPWVWVISYEVISTTGKPDLRQPAKD